MYKILTLLNCPDPYIFAEDRTQPNSKIPSLVKYCSNNLPDRNVIGLNKDGNIVYAEERKDDAKGNRFEVYYGEIKDGNKDPKSGTFTGLVKIHDLDGNFKKEVTLGKKHRKRSTSRSNKQSSKQSSKHSSKHSRSKSKKSKSSRRKQLNKRK